MQYIFEQTVEQIHKFCVELPDHVKPTEAAIRDVAYTSQPEITQSEVLESRLYNEDGDDLEFA